MDAFYTEEQCRSYVDTIPLEPNFDGNKITLFHIVTDIQSLHDNLINTGASNDVIACVEFIFRRYRTGVYVSYTDGLFYFICFINLETPNEYKDYLEIDPIIKEKLPQIVTNINNAFTRKGVDTRYEIKEDPNEWYVTNFLVKIEDYISNEPEFVTFYFYELYAFLFKIFSDQDFINSIGNKRLDFIINHKDQNLLRADNTDPMFHIVNPPKRHRHEFNQPFPSNEFIKICPILSFCRHKDYLDIPIPTPDDISRVMKLYIPVKCNTNYRELWDGEEISLPDWEQRVPIAVFRGSSTGWGLNSQTNPRMKISKLSSKYPTLLDAGITKVVRRYKKVYNEQYIKTNDNRGIQESGFLSFIQQAGYKYQVYIEGNVAAYRLGAMFASGSLILLVKSDYKLWFEPLLRENYNYISINPDLSNLTDVISWCQNNDKICQQIASNGKIFYNNILKDKIFDYTKNILIKLAK